MRRILVDHARARLSSKRGGGMPVLSLDEITNPPDGQDSPPPIDIAAEIETKLRARSEPAAKLFHRARELAARVQDAAEKARAAADEELKKK